MRLILYLFLFLIIANSCKKKTSGAPKEATCSFNDLPANLQNGIITFYSFCGNTNDVSGNNNNGALTAGNFTADRFGNSNSALSLTTNASLVCSSTLFSGPQTFTISGWLKTNSLSYGRVIVFDESQCSHINNWDRTIFIDKGQAGFYVFPGSQQNISGGPNIADNKWHHLAATLSSAGMKLYVDGSLVASNTTITSAQNFSGYWRIGSFQNTTLIGDYDDVLIYNRALSASEIQQLYK